MFIIHSCETRLNPLKVTLTHKTSKTTSAELRRTEKNDKKLEAEWDERASWEEGDRDCVYVFRLLLLFQKMTTPLEEAVYVICKSNMEHDETSDGLKDASTWHLLFMG